MKHINNERPNKKITLLVLDFRRIKICFKNKKKPTIEIQMDDMHYSINHITREDVEVHDTKSRKNTKNQNFQKI